MAAGRPRRQVPDQGAPSPRTACRPARSKPRRRASRSTRWRRPTPSRPVARGSALDGGRVGDRACVPHGHAVGIPPLRTPDRASFHLAVWPPVRLLARPVLPSALRIGTPVPSMPGTGGRNLGHPGRDDALAFVRSHLAPRAPRRRRLRRLDGEPASAARSSLRSAKLTSAAARPHMRRDGG